MANTLTQQCGGIILEIPCPNCKHNDYPFKECEDCRIYSNFEAK